MAPAEEESSVSWQRVTLILELLQHKKKLRRPQVLVPTLFNLLARYGIVYNTSFVTNNHKSQIMFLNVGDVFVSRSLEAETAEHGNMEYTKQLLLSCLLNVCQKISPDGKPVSAGANT